ncbi:MAG: DUF1080 domain-containing protein [Bacteroidota bacterium]
MRILRETNLFNGKDLTGWDTYLPKTGLNNDPDKVFSVVTIDGTPAIKISGQHFGGIATVGEYSNYHLSVEFKWGEAKYAPKLDQKRDSGLLYHGVGEQGTGDGYWLRSQEFQVQEGDCGDYWGVAGAGFDIPVVGTKDKYLYSSSGSMKNFSEKSPHNRHVIKDPDGEKPTGQWNTLDLYCFGDSAVHVVNGKVVMKLYHSRMPDNTPLKKGKIQFQSEGAEVYYRNIEVTPITKMPAL